MACYNRFVRWRLSLHALQAHATNGPIAFYGMALANLHRIK
jgi:hypothetical protein